MRAGRECSDLRRRRTLEASERPAGAVCRGRSQRSYPFCRTPRGVSQAHADRGARPEQDLGVESRPQVVRSAGSRDNPASTGLPVLLLSPSYRPAAEPVGARVARFPTAVSLPRINGGSASALPVSRPAQRSLRVAACVLAESPSGDPSSSECFSAIRYLPAPLRLLPAGATVAGRDSHPLGHSAFPRRTSISGQGRRTTRHGYARRGTSPRGLCSCRGTTIRVRSAHHRLGDSRHGPACPRRSSGDYRHRVSRNRRIQCGDNRRRGYPEGRPTGSRYPPFPRRPRRSRS